jgi:hypothetical protein
MPKLNARVRLIHSVSSAPASRIATPTAAIATASICSRERRSPRKIIPSITLTSGLR